jgi:hypothetical protein
LLSFSVSSSLQAEGVSPGGGAGAPFFALLRKVGSWSLGVSNPHPSTPLRAGSLAKTRGMGHPSVSCSTVSGASGVASGKPSFASAVGRSVAAEDGSGSQRQISPHRRQFMGNNSDDDLDDGTWLHRNLDELRLAGVRQITQPIYLANTPAVGAPRTTGSRKTGILTFSAIISVASPC